MIINDQNRLQVMKELREWADGEYFNLRGINSCYVRALGGVYDYLDEVISTLETETHQVEKSDYDEHNTMNKAQQGLK